MAALTGCCAGGAPLACLDRRIGGRREIGSEDETRRYIGPRGDFNPNDNLSIQGYRANAGGNHARGTGFSARLSGGP